MAAQEVREAIAKEYRASPIQVDILLKYDTAFRAALNSKFNAAVIAPEVDLKHSTSSDIVSVVSQGVGAIPLVGNLVGAATTALGAMAENTLQGRKREDYSKLVALNPNCDTEEFAKFTKTLSKEIIDEKSAAIKALDPEAAKKMAKQDADAILSTIYKSNAIGEIGDSGTIKTLIDSSKVTTRPSEHQHPEHHVFGSFTSRIAKEETSHSHSSIAHTH